MPVRAPATDHPPDDPRRAALLERALLLNIFAHAAGMVSMAALLLPGMPGGMHVDITSRAAYVAGHPWLWRLGWLPWQITAASDLFLCVALVGTRWIPKLPALIATAATLAAIVPDQTGQFRWTREGVLLARRAVETGDFGGYLRFESDTLRLIAAWGTVGYLSGALGWT